MKCVMEMRTENFDIIGGIFMGVQGLARGRGHTMAGAPRHIGMLRSPDVPYTYATCIMFIPIRFVFY